MIAVMKVAIFPSEAQIASKIDRSKQITKKVSQIGHLITSRMR
jgi:hypothetical protein